MGWIDGGGYQNRYEGEEVKSEDWQTYVKIVACEQYTRRLKVSLLELGRALSALGAAHVERRRYPSRPRGVPARQCCLWCIKHRSAAMKSAVSVFVSRPRGIRGKLIDQYLPEKIQPRETCDLSARSLL